MREQAWAALCVAHTFAVLVLALPPAMVKPSDLAKPEVKDWFEDRVQQLGALGLPVDKQALIDQAVWWGGGYEAVRAAAAAPSHFYANLSGARQSWRMFGDVPQSSAFLFIEGSFDGEWRPLYVARSDEAAWRKPFFDQERPRTFFNEFTRRKGKRSWDRFVGWVGPELEQDFPEASAFRVGMQEVKFPATDQLPEHPEHTLGKRFWVEAIEVSR